MSPLFVTHFASRIAKLTHRSERKLDNSVVFLPFLCIKHQGKQVAEMTRRLIVNLVIMSQIKPTACHSIKVILLHVLILLGLIINITFASMTLTWLVN